MQQHPAHREKEYIPPDKTAARWTPKAACRVLGSTAVAEYIQLFGKLVEREAKL